MNIVSWRMKIADSIMWFPCISQSHGVRRWRSSFFSLEWEARSSHHLNYDTGFDSTRTMDLQVSCGAIQNPHCQRRRRVDEAKWHTMRLSGWVGDLSKLICPKGFPVAHNQMMMSYHTHTSLVHWAGVGSFSITSWFGSLSSIAH